MQKSAGSMSVDGSIAYVPQEAFVISTSVKDNILFGKDFNSGQYQETIEATALTHVFMF